MQWFLVAISPITVVAFNLHYCYKGNALDAFPFFTFPSFDPPV